jgi:hypothetical protein
VGPRRATLLLLSGIALTDLAFRVAQVAVPLVVLAGTRSAAATGLAAGATGIPVLLSPWWARHARQRVRTARTVALLYVGEAAALAVVPAAAGLHALSWPVLLGSGLALGCVEALSGPGRDGLLADLGDRIGADQALGLLTTRDLLRRAGMVVGPALGGLAVAAGHGLPLLWLEVVSVLVSAALAAVVPTRRAHADSAEAGAVPPTIRAALRDRPDVLAGWVVRGTGCATWFGFTLGLSLLGAERGRGGVYLATAMTAYGLGSLAGTTLAVPLLRRLPVLRTIVAAWTTTGAAWVVMGTWATQPVVAAASAVMGVLVSVGNAGVTAQITRASSGADRRTLLAGQSVVVNASSSGGLLLGGAVLALLGAAHTLLVTGTLTAVVAPSVLAISARARRASVAPAAPRPARPGRTASAPSPSA